MLRWLLCGRARIRTRIRHHCLGLVDQFASRIVLLVQMMAALRPDRVRERLIRVAVGQTATLFLLLLVLLLGTAEADVSHRHPATRRMIQATRLFNWCGVSGGGRSRSSTPDPTIAAIFGALRKFIMAAVSQRVLGWVGPGLRRPTVIANGRC